jgi:hypothetical protein
MIMAPNGRHPTVDRRADVSAGGGRIGGGLQSPRGVESFGPKEAFLGAVASHLLDRFVERAETTNRHEPRLDGLLLWVSISYQPLKRLTRRGLNEPAAAGRK